MSEPYLGEIRIFSFVGGPNGHGPKGWALCDGALLPINQNQALFSLLGTTFGGDGRVNFALPDLRGRMPIHFSGPTFSDGPFPLGNKGGEETHTLSLGELPAHTHAVIASSAVPNQPGPAGNLRPNGGGAIPYADSPDAAMAPQAIQAAGQGQPHENRAPYLVLTFCICVQGIFPSQV